MQEFSSFSFPPISYKKGVQPRPHTRKMRPRFSVLFSLYHKAKLLAIPFGVGLSMMCYKIRIKKLRRRRNAGCSNPQAKSRRTSVRKRRMSTNPQRVFFFLRFTRGKQKSRRSQSEHGVATFLRFRRRRTSHASRRPCPAPSLTQGGLFVLYSTRSRSASAGSGLTKAVRLSV